jgi:hypothetical protein
MLRKFVCVALAVAVFALAASRFTQPSIGCGSSEPKAQLWKERVEALWLWQEGWASTRSPLHIFPRVPTGRLRIAQLNPIQSVLSSHCPTNLEADLGTASQIFKVERDERVEPPTTGQEIGVPL